MFAFLRILLSCIQYNCHGIRTLVEYYCVLVYSEMDDHSEDNSLTFTMAENSTTLHVYLDTVTLKDQLHMVQILDCGPVANAILYTTFILESILVMTFNMGTVTVLIRSKNLRKHVTNILIAYLSIADFCVGPTALYYTVTSVLKFPVNARVHGFFINIGAVLSLRFSLATLTLITVDRLVAVWRPLSYSKIITKKRAHVMVAITWVYIILIIGVPVTIGMFKADPYVVLTGTPRDYLPPAIYQSILQPHVYIPVILNVIMYGFVFRALAKQARKVASSGSADSEERRRLQNRRIAKMMLFILIGLVVTICPFGILIQLYKPTDPLAPAWWQFTLQLSYILLYSNMWMNPVIYRWQSPEWRRAYLSMMRCENRNVGDSSLGNSDTKPSTTATQLQSTQK